MKATVLSINWLSGPLLAGYLFVYHGLEQSLAFVAVWAILDRCRALLAMAAMRRRGIVGVSKELDARALTATILSRRFENVLVLDAVSILALPWMVAMFFLG
jgi:hypothetical protein